MARRKQTDAEIIAEARKRFERCVTWETTARENAKADRKFAAGDSYNGYQWDTGVAKARGARPCLTNNVTRQHNLLIVNEARQAKAAIKVTPTGGKATYEAAQIFSGIVRRIEYQSKAIDAYSTAIFHQVESGIGYCRVVTDFVDEEDFDQDILIKRVPDPDTIYLDPDAKDWDKADMRFAFVFADIPRDQYEAKHGKDDVPADAPLDHSDWYNEDHVREAEYWRRDEQTDKLHLLTDGTTVRESTLQPGEMAQLKDYIDKSRDVSEPMVECFILRGDTVAERKSWLGKYIPIVPFIGEETVIDRVMDRKGHTRSMLDPQRIANYWSSAAVEYVALQTKTPYIARADAIEGHVYDWEHANTQNKAVLLYNGLDDTGQKIDRPEREQPPVMAQAYIEGLKMAHADIMMVSGQHQSDLGMPGNERSGKAIDARQRQSEMSVAHFTDNQAKAIRQIGRICLDLIPRIYDQARVIKIMAEDGSDTDVHVVPNAPEAHQHVEMTPDGPKPLTSQQADEMREDPKRPDPKIIFSPLVGRYDVEADVGPSYGTQRQEASNAFAQIMAQNKEAFAVLGDLWAQNSDFPGADKLAERLRKGIPAQYTGGPSPEMQQMQAQAHDLLGKADAEIAGLKQQNAALTAQMKDKGASTTIDDYKAETERLKAIAAADPAAAQVVIRSMLSELLGMPALPVMHEHMAADAAHMQAIAPPEPAETMQ